MLLAAIAGSLREMKATDRVAGAMRELGLPGEVIEFEASTRTAQEAAEAVGCEPGQIVKTLCFLADGRPTITLVAGDRNVDTAALAKVVGVGRKKLKMGTPAEVLELTGFEIGGVSPVGMPATYDTVLDESLQRFEVLWAAAGAGNAVFRVERQALATAVNGQWAAITRDNTRE